MLRPIALAALALSLSPAALAADFAPGDRVLVNGLFHRKCSARVQEVKDGQASLQFDRAGCGDAATVALRSLQRLHFLEGRALKAQSLQPGDAVLVKGFFDSTCGGKVKEITRSGLVAVDLDSALCADGLGLRKAAELRKVSFVEEKQVDEQKFRVGQRVAVAGIHEKDNCRGKIARITNNGYAALAFDELTCAYGGKLYSLDALEPVRSPASVRKVTGDDIFRRVMREIAESRAGK